MTVPDWSQRGPHITFRSRRGGGADVLPAWADEAYLDPNAVTVKPDPTSKSGISWRVIGYSDGAQHIVTVVVYEEEGILWGASAWFASDQERRTYWEAEG